jgi:hypothetical protein
MQDVAVATDVFEGAEPAGIEVFADPGPEDFTGLLGHLQKRYEIGIVWRRLVASRRHGIVIVVHRKPHYTSDG